MKINYLILGILFISQLSMAQSVVGNGGDVVVCRNAANVITSIELLDFYEARDLRQIQYDLGDPTLSVEEKIQLALNRLSRLDPFREEQYSKRAQAFITEAQFVTNKELPDISDSGHLVFPIGCKVEQIVISDVHRFFPEDELWLPKTNSSGYLDIVNADLWNHPLFNNDQKAGLILHEIIYKEARHEFEQKHSIYARYLNSYVASSKLNEYTIKDYVELLNRVRFNRLNYKGFIFNTSADTNKFYPNGNPQSVIIKDEDYSYPPRPRQPIIFPQYITIFEKTRLQLDSDFPLELYENGTLQHVHIKETIWRSIFAFADRRMGLTNELWFLPNGDLEAITSYGSKTSIDIPNSQKIHEILEKMTVNFTRQNSGIPEAYSIDLFFTSLNYNLDQFFIFGEALNSLSEPEREVVAKRLEELRLEQSYAGACSIFSETPCIQLSQKIEAISETDRSWRPHKDPIQYTMTLWFDNNRGEKEFVTEEEILEAFQKIIRGQ